MYERPLDVVVKGLNCGFAAAIVIRYHDWRIDMETVLAANPTCTSVPL